MREITESDFAPLDGFPLLWRWTKPSHAMLPSSVLATIRPLIAATAAELASEATARCAERQVAEWELAISAEGDAAAQARERLEALGIDPDARIVVSWSRDMAVVTLWRTFTAHWEDFCYPSSDDVSVWAPGAEWTLCYRHFEVFEFSSSHRAV